MSNQNWTFDLSHSSINFAVRHLMVSKVRGHFGAWSGTFSFDEADPASAKVSVQIDAASIETKEPKRDEHLRSADFLEVEKFPHITFESTSVERRGDGDLRVHGDLTIHGITRPVALDVEYAGRAKDPWGGERAGFTATTKISRKDFGLTWNLALEAGGVVVGDAIEIGLEIEAIKEVAVQAPVAQPDAQPASAAPAR